MFTRTLLYSLPLEKLVQPNNNNNKCKKKGKAMPVRGHGCP
jgi:hypothetical protein